MLIWGARFGPSLSQKYLRRFKNGLFGSLPGNEMSCTHRKMGNNKNKKSCRYNTAVLYKKTKHYD